MALILVMLAAMGITTNGGQGILRLVASEASPVASLDGSSWPVDLRRSPYRPGELPESLCLDLDRRTAERARVIAGAEGVPVALWIRAAVEAGRARDLLAEMTARQPEEIEALLLEAAARPEDPRGISALERYARAVSVGGVSERSSSAVPLELLVPSELILAWRTAAAASALPTEIWVAEMISTAPTGVARLEARAAGEGESLAAWCYAAFLTSSERRRASAQPRT
jgi:hypothetical protein